MFKLYMALYVAVLFVALTPGVLLSIPPKGSKIVVALTHGIVFAVVLSLTYNQVSAIVGNVSEGFEKKSGGKQY